MRNEPWFTSDSIKLLDKFIKNDFIGLEYGTGGSTVWFARRMKHLTSIEHDNKWYLIVLDEIKKSGCKNIKLLLISRENYKYANAVITFPDKFFDIVSIDGRDRVKCIENSINKIKPGGILVLDNSERKRYIKGKELMKDWEKFETTNGRWYTTIYIKPVLIL